MSGRTMVRCRVGIDYFSFLVDGFAVFFAAGFAAALAGAFAAFATVFFAAVLAVAPFFAPDTFSTGAGASSATGSIAGPTAPAFTTTTSDHTMCYVAASLVR